MSLRGGIALGGAPQPHASRQASLLAAVAVLGVGLSAAAASAPAQAAPAMSRAVAALNPNPSSTDNELFGVSAVSGTDAWAVGRYTNNTTHVVDTLVLHWNGAAWSRVPSPSPGPGGSVLLGVNAVSAADAWAVGFSQGTTGSQATLILHWNGRAWSQVPSPNPSSPNNELTGVSAVSGTDAWAVGDRGSSSAGQADTLALHWNGTAWSQVKSPNPSSNPSSPSNELTGVSAVSGTDAWAVGDYGTVTGQDTLALRWNGTAWSQVKTPNPSGRFGPDVLLGVSAASGTDAWAVGEYVNNTTNLRATLALHWNGTAWSRVASPSPGRSVETFNLLHGVSIISGTDAWAAGDYLTNSSSTDTLILHWDGSAWSKVASPNPSGGLGADNELYGVSGVSGTDAWAVGYFINSKGVFDTLILHWNGTAWSRM